MRRYWICHWKNRYWRDDVNPEFRPLTASGSDRFRERGVSPSDRLYIVSLANGHLLLGGRLTVERIVTRRKAIEMLGTTGLYDADEWAMAQRNSGTPLILYRRLAPDVTRQLRVLSPRDGPKELFFVSRNHLDNQATRGIRELTRESAELLDHAIAATDPPRGPRPMLTVTTRMLQSRPHR